MYKSLYADREKIIEKLKTCLKGYIGITKLNKVRLSEVILSVEGVI